MGIKQRRKQYFVIYVASYLLLSLRT